MKCLLTECSIVPFIFDKAWQLMLHNLQIAVIFMKDGKNSVVDSLQAIIWTNDA